MERHVGAIYDHVNNLIKIEIFDEFLKTFCDTFLSIKRCHVVDLLFYLYSLEHICLAKNIFKKSFVDFDKIVLLSENLKNFNTKMLICVTLY